MNEILSIAATVLLLVAAFAALVAWGRRDNFTGTKYLLPDAPAGPVESAEPAASPAPSAPSIRAGVLRLN